MALPPQGRRRSSPTQSSCATTPRADAGRGEVIVVTKVSPAQTCQVAHIDALATPEPMVLAHKIADEAAPSFDCRREPAAAGTIGKNPL